MTHVLSQTKNVLNQTSTHAYNKLYYIIIIIGLRRGELKREYPPAPLTVIHVAAVRRLAHVGPAASGQCGCDVNDGDCNATRDLRHNRRADRCPVD